MKKREWLPKEEVQRLLINAKNHEQDSWSRLVEEFDLYVKSRVRYKLNMLAYVETGRRKELEEELYQAGWQGFVEAAGRYNPAKGEFLTYATWDIDGAISKELDLQLNPLGLTGRKKYKKNGSITFSM